MKHTPHSPDHAAACHDLRVIHRTAPGAPPTVALDGVSLSLPAGQMTSVVGPSGSGKSTLLHTMAGFSPASAGRLTLLGRDITHADASAISALHREGVGFIFQSYNLVPSLPVIDNILLPSRFARRRTDRDRAAGVLEHLGLGHRIGHRTVDLSGGEQQRVAVARVLYDRPAVVFADEPTGALDSATSSLVLSCLRRLADDGTAVLLVTHDVPGAALADHAVVLRDGRVVEHMDSPRANSLWDAIRPEVSRV